MERVPGSKSIRMSNGRCGGTPVGGFKERGVPGAHRLFEFGEERDGIAGGGAEEIFGVVAGVVWAER